MKKYVTAAFVLGLLLSGSSAKADPLCSATTLNNILGTTCTIGDKTVAFSAATSDFISGITPSQILFTPDTGSPLSPGFTLSLASGGPFSVTATGAVQSQINANFNYVVSVTDGSASLLGDTFTLANAQVTLGTATGDNAITDITNFLGGLSGASVEAFIQCAVPPLATGCSTSQGPEPVSGTGTLPTALSTALGQAGFEVVAQAGGSDTVGASFTSATYLFNEAPPTPTPEPSSLVLLGTGLLGTVGLMRRKMVLHKTDLSK